MKAKVMAYVMGRNQDVRIALECDSKEEAIRKLNRAFGKPNNNEWCDSMGQKFYIDIIK